jgi:hypothetical protein
LENARTEPTVQNLRGFKRASGRIDNAISAAVTRRLGMAAAEFERQFLVKLPESEQF